MVDFSTVCTIWIRHAAISSVKHYTVGILSSLKYSTVYNLLYLRFSAMDRSNGSHYRSVIRRIVLMDLISLKLRCTYGRDNNGKIIKLYRMYV